MLKGAGVQTTTARNGRVAHKPGRALAAGALGALPLAAWALFVAAGCGGGGGAGVRDVTLDGRVAEWRGSTVASADERSLYVRFSVGDERAALQYAPETTRLLLDVDNDPATGRLIEGPEEVGRLGVDVEVMLSPRREELPEAMRGRGGPAEGLSAGVAVALHGAGGTRHVGAAGVGFVCTPTFASEWYEARLDRLASELIGSGLDGAGSGRGMVMLTDASGGVTGWTEAFTFTLPEAALAPELAEAAVPAAGEDGPGGAVRVMSYNVLRSALREDPEPFARLIKSVSPDVLLLQESDGMDAAELSRWLGEHVGPAYAGDDGVWHAAAFAERGVAVASPHEVVWRQEDGVVASVEGRDVDVRAVAAVVRTPAGDALAVSVHYKCCGGYGTSEDVRRRAEAEAVASFVAEQGAARGAAIRVVGGDFNLVGGREPLDLTAAGADVDGSALAAAEALVLGANATFTWRDPRTAFAPGRLDWVLYADAAARVERAFVLDTGRLSDGALLASGLSAGDCSSSDHLPVVVDLRPR